MAAKEMAKGDEKLTENVDTLLKEIPPLQAPKKPSAAATSLGAKEKPKVIDPEKAAEEEETVMLGTLSNAQWLLYPFKKMVIAGINKLFGSKYKAEKRE